MDATTQQPPRGVYTMIVASTTAWLIANTAKPTLVAFTALVSTVSASTAGGVAIIAQLNVTDLQLTEWFGGSVGVGLVLWSIRFFRSVYREALEITQTQLDDARHELAADRQRFINELASRDERIQSLHDTVDELRDIIDKLRDDLTGPP